MSLPTTTPLAKVRQEEPTAAFHRLYFFEGSCGWVTTLMGPSPLFGVVHTRPQRSQR